MERPITRDGYFAANNYSPADRKRLFYLVCVPVRILLASAVIYFSPSKTLVYVLLAASILSIGYNIYQRRHKGDHPVWWDRRLETVIAAGVLFTCALTIYRKKYSTFYPGILLFLDVFMGLVLAYSRKESFGYN